jgi:hypothetical protein
VRNQHSVIQWAIEPGGRAASRNCNLLICMDNDQGVYTATSEWAVMPNGGLVMVKGIYRLTASHVHELIMS